MGLGVAEAWATACDVYFGVYCLLLAAGYVVATNVQLHRVPSPAVRRSYVRALDILVLCLVGLVAALLVRHGLADSRFSGGFSGSEPSTRHS